MTTTLPARAPLAPQRTQSWSTLLRQVLRPLPAPAPPTPEAPRRRRSRPSIAPLEWG